MCPQRSFGLLLLAHGDPRLSTRRVDSSQLIDHVFLSVMKTATSISGYSQWSTKNPTSQPIRHAVRKCLRRMMLHGSSRPPRLINRVTCRRQGQGQVNSLAGRRQARRAREFVAYEVPYWKRPQHQNPSFGDPGIRRWFYGLLCFFLEHQPEHGDVMGPSTWSPTRSASPTDTFRSGSGRGWVWCQPCCLKEPRWAPLNN